MTRVSLQIRIPERSHQRHVLHRGHVPLGRQKSCRHASNGLEPFCYMAAEAVFMALGIVLQAVLAIKLAQRSCKRNRHPPSAQSFPPALPSQQS